MNKKCGLQLLAKVLNNPNVLTYDGFATLMGSIEIYLTKKEYLQIFSATYAKQFVGYAQIPTLMRRKVSNHYAFDSEELYEGIDLLVAYTDDAGIDCNHAYSIEELQTLLDCQKIIVIMEYALDCSYEVREKTDTYQAFGPFDFMCMLDKTSPFYPAFVLYLKDHLDASSVASILYQLETQDSSDDEYVKKIKNPMY